MSSTVEYRVTAPPQPVPDYSPLIEATAGRLLAPTTANIVIDVSGEPHLGQVVAELALVDRRYRIVKLEATPPDDSWLDIEALRRVDVGGCARGAIEHLVRFEQMLVEGEASIRWAMSRRIADVDNLAAVATVYAVAYAFGERPTKAVVEAFGLSQAAAAHRVMRARAAGYLLPTTQGRAS
ncbi:hypothetical protein BH24ACT5_BH24ACT5_13150 [soil metagenome]